MLKVTIICPLYNKVNYIERTIYSAEQQDYSEWEMIIVDDGSTDGSFELVSNYIQNKEKIKLLKREEFSSYKGGNVCRNIGIKQASGDYIIFLDADDLLEPYCLRQRISFIEKDPGLSFYVFNVAYCKGENAIPYSKFRPSFAEKLKFLTAVNKNDYFLKKFLKFDLAWHTSGPIWSKTSLLNINGFNESFQRLQDPEIHTRALLDGDITFKYLMNISKHDILHRTDDDRLIWDKLEFFKKRIDSISQYLVLFIPKVQEKRKEYIYKLQGYIVEAEVIAYRSIRDEGDLNNIDFYNRQLATLYDSENIHVIYNWKFKLFKSLFRQSLKRRVFIKMKIPGVLLLLFRKVIL